VRRYLLILNVTVDLAAGAWPEAFEMTGKAIWRLQNARKRWRSGLRPDPVGELTEPSPNLYLVGRGLTVLVNMQFRLTNSQRYLVNAKPGTNHSTNSTNPNEYLYSPGNPVATKKRRKTNTQT